MSQLGRDSMDLLDAARAGDDPMPEDRARMRRRLAQLGVGAAVTTAASTTAAASSAVGTGTAAASAVKGAVVSGFAAASSSAGTLSFALAVKMAVTVLVIGSIGAATAEGLSVHRAKGVATAESRAVGVTVAVAPPAPAVAAVSPKPEAPIAAFAPKAAAPVVAPIPRDPPALNAPPATLRTAPVVAALDDDTLADELRLIESAVASRNGHDPARALAILEQYDAQFPQGKMAQERAAQRILTLCDLGRVAEASTESQRFLSAWPRSIQAPLVRGSCARDSSR